MDKKQGGKETKVSECRKETKEDKSISEIK